jgi:hypothetical protein
MEALLTGKGNNYTYKSPIAIVLAVTNEATKVHTFQVGFYL